MTDKDRIKLREITEQISYLISMLIEMDNELKDIDETNAEVKMELDDSSDYLKMVVSHLGLVCELIDKAYNIVKEKEDENRE